jgi:hypothetical protein
MATSPAAQPASPLLKYSNQAMQTLHPRGEMVCIGSSGASEICIVEPILVT